MPSIYKLLFLIFSSICMGQNYRPLLDNYNQWHFTTCNFGCLTDKYYTNGDTIVNGLNHKILDGYHYSSRTFLIREEIISKKIFLTKINENSISEYLLYDFSLNEGSLFNMNNPVSPFPRYGGEFILDSIRIKPLVNNINFKHFYFSPSPNNSVTDKNVVWIEGIGSLSIINAPGGFADINGVSHLSCFFKNENLVYSNLDSISDCSYQNLNKNAFKNILKMHSTNEKNVFQLSNSSLIYSVETIDIYGKYITKNYYNQSKSILIDLKNYQKGIYFLVVIDKKSRKKTFKVIVG